MLGTVLVLGTAAALCLGYYVQARASFDLQVATPHHVGGSTALSPAKGRRVTPLDFEEHAEGGPPPLALEPAPPDLET